jgi:hypothetical protein
VRTEGGPDSGGLRAAASRATSGEVPSKGGILKALLASPLVGSELDLTRSREDGRKIASMQGGLAPTALK